MSLENFFSEREALHCKGELYKIEVIRYYESQGYYLIKNSTYDSIISDLIMEKPDHPQIWVEVKDTSGSIFAKTQSLKKEMLKYFIEWIKVKETNPFEFHIFISELSKIDETKKIITKDCNKNLLLEWYNDRSDMGFDKDTEDQLSSISDDDIYKFFSNTSIKICPGYKLSKRNEEFSKKFNSPLVNKAQRLLNEINTRKLPNSRKSQVFFNFLEIIYSKTFYEIFSKYKLAKKVYNVTQEKYPDIELPCMMIPRFESILPKIRSFDPNIEIFFCVSRNKRKYEKDFSVLNIQRQRELLNRHLNHFMYCKGLRRYNRDFCFSYEKSLIDIEEKDSTPLFCNSYTGEDKRVAIPRYKDGKLNFVEHKSITAYVDLYDNKWVVFLWPGFIFTKDGVNILEGDQTSRLQKIYNSSDWNRNPNKRSELNFWNFYLSNDVFPRKKEIWFDSFKLKKPNDFYIGWSSSTIEKDQHSILKWMGGS